MSDDFLKGLGDLGVTARIKRLSDSLNTSIKTLYRDNGVDIEPGWHLVLLYLSKRKESSMSEIADAMRLSQPALTKIVNRMIAKGYLGMDRSDDDKRRKILRLSVKSTRLLNRFKEIWAAGSGSVSEILKDNPEFLIALEKMEDTLDRQSFNQRAQRLMNDD